MGRKFGKSAIEVMRERFPANASEIETYADAFDVLAEKVNSGGGSGSGLPAVTTGDNGSILEVVNGAWNKSSKWHEIRDVNCNVDMTSSPPSISTTDAFNFIYEYVLSGGNARLFCVTNTGISGYEQNDFIPLTRVNNESGGTLVFGAVINLGGGSLVYFNVKFTSNGMTLDTPIPITGNGG